MGRESRGAKVRGCPVCQERFHASSLTHTEHVILCQRMKELDLVLAKMMVPGDRFLIEEG